MNVIFPNLSMTPNLVSDMYRSQAQPTIGPMQRSAPGRFHSGLITWGILLSMLLLMILVALVSNVAILVNRKMEVQNSSDAIAYSSSVWIARGMNSVSATNHVIGEMNALYTIHHALGGKWLDERPNRRNSGDWAFTLPAIPYFGGYGGFWYKITHYALQVTFWLARIASWKNDIEEWIPPWLPSSGPGPNKSHYNRVSEHPKTDINSAIWEGKEHLKIRMLAAYVNHLNGALQYSAGHKLYPIPWTSAKGLAMMKAGAAAKRAARKMADMIHAQYLVLDNVESIAISPLRQAKLALPDIIKTVHIYQQAHVKVEIPGKAFRTAQNIGKRTSCLGIVLGGLPDIPSGGMGNIASNLSQIFPSLPVEPEKVTNEGRSQMVRATYPWVRKWRYNIYMVLTTLAPSSYANDGFIKWTNTYARQSSQWLRTDAGQKCDNELTVINRRGRSRGQNGKGIRLYTIKELNTNGQKSQEVWNIKGLTGSKKADELFCGIGFAKSEKPDVISRMFFRQENPHGILCYSQAMIYNANSQQTPATGGKNQPKVGWDTLAWDHDLQRVREWENPGGFQRMMNQFLFFSDDNPIGVQPEPKIKLNWQAKLTPVTVHKIATTAPAAMAIDGDVRKVLWNAREGQFLLQNH
jgi:hypothetical protein